MARRKSLGGNGIAPMIGGSASVPANKNSVKAPAALKGSKAGKAKRGKRSGGSLSTLSGKSGIMNPPTQGGYS